MSSNSAGLCFTPGRNLPFKNNFSGAPQSSWSHSLLRVTRGHTSSQSCHHTTYLRSVYFIEQGRILLCYLRNLRDMSKRSFRSISNIWIQRLLFAGCRAMAEEPIISHNLIMATGRRDYLYLSKRNKREVKYYKSCLGFELWSLCPFPLTIAATLRAPLFVSWLGLEWISSASGSFPNQATSSTQV